MRKLIDGNEGAALSAYAINEIASIYPITPSSTMAELCEKWSGENKPNLFSSSMRVIEMQSEAGAAGCLHGALVGGKLATTFTASQGLLLMIPNMYKIAGELLPATIHVSARTVATHALSIFGDHSDIYATRSTGFNFMCAANPQEAHDFAFISSLCAIKSSLPFLHFFDGFRTSHEISVVDCIENEHMQQLFNYDDIQKSLKSFRERALNPNQPTMLGSAQNPDVFFQNREACTQFYQKVPQIVKEQFDRFYTITNRQYNLFDYYGANDAENVIVVMGSAYGTIKEYVDYANSILKQKLGVIVVRLFLPFDEKSFINCLPSSVKNLCVLDRAKDSNMNLDPLGQIVLTTLAQNGLNIKLTFGRYGLGGFEFTPAMVKSIYDNMNNCTIKNFTIGIKDDVTFTSLDFDSNFNIPGENMSCKFYGFGSDGTVSASKSSIKIIGEESDLYCQGYFEYDSKKSGSMTISHLKFGKNEIKGSYLISHADFIAIHKYSFLEKYDVLSTLKIGGKVLLNCPINKNNILDKLPNTFVEKLKEKNAKLFIINADEIAQTLSLKGKINTVMQAAFFSLMDTLDKDVVINKMKNYALKLYGKKGEDVVKSNYAAIDSGFENVEEINVLELTSNKKIDKNNQNVDNEYYNSFIKPILSLNGNTMPVSKFSPSGCVPTDTSKFEKRGISLSLPKWIPEKCIQCGRCTLSCPHATIKPIILNEEEKNNLPESVICRNLIGSKNNEYFMLYVDPQNCTGCGVCQNACPVKDKAIEMINITEQLEISQKIYDVASQFPQKTSLFQLDTCKGAQFLPSYFEFSGACAGCGETPYIRLLTSLFGNKMIISNATGCSSIYGGSCPTCPYSKDKNGCGPAWANSLFEDNAEFGLGIKLANYDNDKSVWIIGGDGWAYDIGFGGLDHVLASGENINILVLDTEVYSNTGGQCSKSTPRGASAKFAEMGKNMRKKDLAAIAMTYENVYVAQISLGANFDQSIKAFIEAENHNGPSLIIAYCPCINHGIDMSKTSQNMNEAVRCGYFNLFRYNPNNEQKLTIDSNPNFENYSNYCMSQNRFKSLLKINKNYMSILQKAKIDAENRFENFKV